MATVAANKSKVCGIGHKEALIKKGDEGGVSMFDVPTVRYSDARMAEIMQAWRDVQEDIASGDVVSTTVEEHLRHLDEFLKSENDI